MPVAVVTASSSTEDQLSEALPFIVIKLTLVKISIVRQLMSTPTMLHVVQQLSHVSLSVLVLQPHHSLHLAIVVPTFVNLPIWENFFAESMLLPFRPLTFVAALCLLECKSFLGKFTFTVLLVCLEQASVDVTLCCMQLTLSMLLAIKPQTFVHGSAVIFHFSVASYCVILE